MAITDLIYGLTPHLQQNQMIKSMAMPRMNLSSEDYNVISSMNAANNMNAGITSLFGPAALYTLGDTISNPNQNFMEGLSDFGRYMKGVQIADNPGLARKLMGNAYVNDMQSKYDRAMNEIGLFTPSRTPMMDIANQDLDPVLEQFYSSPKINKPASVFSQQPFNDYYGPNNIDTSFGVANEEDEEEDVEGATKKGGLADLFRAAIGFAVPGASLFMGAGRGALEGIQSLNQRLRNTTFGRSETLADYFQARRDQKARKEAARRGALKQKQIIASQQVDTGDIGGGGAGSSFDAPSGGTFGSSVNDAGSFSDYS
jgi:hypothetical protein